MDVVARTRRGWVFRALSIVVLLAAFALTACETSRDDAQAIINIINNERYQRGIPLVPENVDLAAEADRWAQEMRNTCTLKHRSNLATGLPAGWTMVAENVGVGGDYWAVHNAFMNSPSHRANILNANYTHVGVGAVWGNCWGQTQMWVVYIFMRYG